MPTDQGPNAIEIETEYPEQIVAHYSNRAQLFVANSDFVIDFLMTEPALPGLNIKAIFQSRIVMSPQQAKVLSEVMAQNIKKYEETFGPVSVAPVTS